jgi:prephenate dehydrogenase (NADP+)
MNIGIIGLGDMGRLYAKAFAKAGYTVCGCDLPENRDKLEEELTPYKITIMVRRHCSRANFCKTPRDNYL